ERHVPRSVAWRGYDLQAADAVAGLEQRVGLRLDLGPTAGQAAVDDLLAGQDARVRLGAEELDRWAQLGPQLVDRARVIEVAVGERDPPDLGPGGAGGGDDRACAVRDQRVDEREPVVLADEVGVDQLQA